MNIQATFEFRIVPGFTYSDDELITKGRSIIQELYERMIMETEIHLDEIPFIDFRDFTKNTNTFNMTAILPFDANIVRRITKGAVANRMKLRELFRFPTLITSYNRTLLQEAQVVNNVKLTDFSYLEPLNPIGGKRKSKRKRSRRNRSTRSNSRQFI